MLECDVAGTCDPMAWLETIGAIVVFCGVAIAANRTFEGIFGNRYERLARKIKREAAKKARSTPRHLPHHGFN
jgi:hypothetical protein